MTPDRFALRAYFDKQMKWAAPVLAAAESRCVDRGCEDDDAHAAAEVCEQWWKVGGAAYYCDPCLLAALIGHAKELQAQIAAILQQAEADAATIAQLQAEIDRLARERDAAREEFQEAREASYLERAEHAEQTVRTLREALTAIERRANSVAANAGWGERHAEGLAIDVRDMARAALASEDR